MWNLRTDKYSLLNSEILQQPIQIQISKKEKAFSDFFTQFLKSTSNFEHFETKRWPSSLRISKFHTPKDVVTEMS